MGKLLAIALMLAMTLPVVATADVLTIDTETATVAEIAEAIKILQEKLVLVNGGYEPGIPWRISTGLKPA